MIHDLPNTQNHLQMRNLRLELSWAELGRAGLDWAHLNIRTNFYFFLMLVILWPLMLHLEQYLECISIGNGNLLT